VPAPGKPVPGGGDQHKVFFKQRLALDAVRHHRHEPDSDTQRPVLDAGLNVRTGQFVELERYQRMQGREAADDFGNQIGVHGLNDTDREGPPLEPLFLGNRHLRQFHLPQGPPGMLAKNRSGPRQLNRSPHAIEQRHPHLPLGGLGEMQRIGHGEKIPEMAKFHAAFYHKWK
jgi:hypothetical protein